MAQNNEIYFSKSIIIDASEKIPEFILNFWDVDFYRPTLGCIRTSDNKVVAIYFYIQTNVMHHAIIKFNYIKEEMIFDSIYVEQNDFYMDQPFCAQNKTKLNSKNYSRHSEPQPANDALKKISKSYLTEEITDELISCFYPTDNINEIYYLIR